MAESPTVITDIGRRASDVIHLHVITGSVGKWAALRLEDGGSDNVPYDTRADAIRNQVHEQFCCYVRVPPDGMPPEDALQFIMLNRALYAQGYRLADPDMPGEPVYPMTDEEAYSIIMAAGKGIL